MQWITATHLKDWANRIESQAILPLLIRQLINTTCNSILKINIPAGDSVQSGGWDGILQTSSATEYIPEGISCWEMGTKKEIKGKADQDYEKRTLDPLGYELKSTTFVFVTPRTWKNKEKWCKEKKDENKWKDIIAYDADDIEQWLEKAPAISAWFAYKYLGIYTENAQSLEKFWEDWATLTKPNININLLLAGRNREVEGIKNWLSNPASEFIVKASSKQEAIAFFYSVIKSLPDEIYKKYISRIIISHDINGYRQLSILKNKHIIINNYNGERASAKAVSNGHHVYIPEDFENTAVKEDLSLPQSNSKSFIEALISMGITKDLSRELSKDVGRNLFVLRRRLSNSSNQPEWAKDKNYQDIIPALLVGRWDENNENDKNVLENLSNKSYNEFSSSLKRWINNMDSPLYNINSLWRLTSHFDAFSSLAHFITLTDLDNFRKIIVQIFTEKNLALEISPDERWATSTFNKAFSHSSHMREGIAKTLILIAVHGEEMGLQLNTSPKSWIDSIVYELLNDADWKRWQSLSDVLKLLAEATPEIFLNMVEKSLKNEDLSIMKLFVEDDDIFFSSSRHTELLWALEGIAWDSNLVSRVSLILLRLVQIDPGGKTANRPFNSLKNIFCIWHPQTSASIKERKEILELLLQKDHEITFKLLIALIPSRHDWLYPSSKWLWRDFGNQNSNVFDKDIYEFIIFIVDKVVTDLTFGADQWIRVIENLRNIPGKENRKKIISKFSSNINFLKEDHKKLYDSLREFITSHRSHRDADWALPEDELIEIEKIYNVIEPQNIIDKIAWLFDSDWYDIIEIDSSIEERKRIIEEKRIDAVKEVLALKKIDGIFELSNKVRNVWNLVKTTAEVITKTDDENELISFINENISDTTLNFVLYFIHNKANLHGEKWIKEKVKFLEASGWPDDSKITFLISLPENKYTWELLKSFNNEVQKKYWEKCPARFAFLKTDSLIFGIEQLIQSKRYAKVLGLIAINPEIIPSKIIIESLQKLVSSNTDLTNEINLREHDIFLVFKELDKRQDIKEKELFHLEWSYLALLTSFYSSRPPIHLYKGLAEDPNFFIEIISLVYKSDTDPEEDIIPDDKLLLAENAYKLIHNWNFVPGLNLETNEIDINHLELWVSVARKIATEQGYLKICDDHIGKILGEPVIISDGVQLPEEICDVIEYLDSENVNSGFSLTIYNKRGVVKKELFEGGDQERELSIKYQKCSDSIRNKFPVVASIFSMISDEYANEAVEADRKAKKEELEY